MKSFSIKKFKLGKLKGQKDYLLAFFLPILILFLIYIIRGVYPFGDQCFLRSDMYHQYAPFHAALLDKLQNGESLLYSWDIGMGVNFIALFAYYLATPFNWLLLIIPQTILIEVMSIFIFIKVGLSGVTFTYYINKHFNTRSFSAALLSLFYSLSAYICAYSWNLMWLDCIWLFPLIMLGLEWLTQGKQAYLYCITLGLCIMSNYYIAFMVCIFCILYFILQISIQPNSFSHFLRKCGRFTIYSALAGGFAACLLIPEYFALQLTVSGDFNFPNSFTRYFSILEMISRQLIMVEPAIFSAHEPNIYCGMLIFLLVPLYAMNPNTNTKEKIGRFFLLALFYLSFNLNIPNYIWHGFHFPNSLPCRQSFIFNFLLLVMSYEGLKDIHSYTNKEIYTTLGSITILFLVIEEIFAGDSYPYYIIYISLAFLALYALYFGLIRSNKLPRLVCCEIFFILITLEAFVNTTATSVNTTGRTSYVSDNQAITSLLETASKLEGDSSFYRIEKLRRRSKNDAAWSHYHGMSLFSSTANAGVSAFLSNLGGEKSTNSYAYYGATPFVEALFNIKYVLSSSEKEENNLRTLIDQKDMLYLYQNKYTLSLGILVPLTLEENWTMSSSNPFSVQNSFADLAAKVAPLFSTVEHTISENKLKIKVETDQHIYVYITSSGENFGVTYEKPDGTSDSKSFSSVKQKYIFDLGYCTSGTMIQLTANEQSTIQGYIYALNQDNMDAFYQSMKEQCMIISEYDDTHIIASVNAKKKSVLFTTIPYEKGWTVTVDGEKVETFAFEDAFLAFEIESGNHQIKFSYSPYGLKTGIAITSVSLIIFCGLIFYGRKYRKERIISETSIDTNTKANIDINTDIDAKANAETNTDMDANINTKTDAKIKNNTKTDINKKKYKKNLKYRTNYK